jgi:hypothetical protein
MKIYLGVIQSSDCFACRGCCTFDARYQDYAPLFTAAQRDRVLAERPGEGITFTPAGALWRIGLRELPGTGRCVCPLLDPESWRCGVYDDGIFECDTWPYQVQVRGGRRVLTVTPECPAVTGERMDALRARGEELLPLMREALDRHPERLIPDYEGVIEIAALDALDPGPDAGRSGGGAPGSGGGPQAPDPG